MKLTLALVAALIIRANALVADDAKLIHAIGVVESGMDFRAVGDQGRAVGAYQMHPEAWQDANAWRKAQGLPAFPRHEWRDQRVQLHMAQAYMNVLRKRLLGLGFANPSPGLLAVCWNKGLEGARRDSFRSTRYAKRVVSIEQSPHGK